MALVAGLMRADLDLAQGAGLDVNRSSSLDRERLAAVQHYATSSLRLPWHHEDFAYPLLAPPVPVAANDASGSCANALCSGSSFASLFGPSRSNVRRLQESLETCPAGRATKGREATALAERLVGKSQKFNARSTGLPAPAPKSFGIPADWRWDDHDDEHELERKDESKNQQGIESSEGIGIASSTSLDLAASTARVQVGAGSLGPKTFHVPDELFGEARLELRDTISGPAQVWHSARSNAGIEAGADSWPGTIGALAGLDESLQAALDRGEQGSSARAVQLRQDAEDDILARAFEREEATQKAARAELARTLQQLRDLESAMQMPAAVPKKDPSRRRIHATPKHGSTPTVLSSEQPAETSPTTGSQLSSASTSPPMGLSGFGSMAAGSQEKAKSVAAQPLGGFLGVQSSAAGLGSLGSLGSPLGAPAPPIASAAPTMPIAPAAPMAPKSSAAPAGSELGSSTAAAGRAALSSLIGPLENRAKMIKSVENAQAEVEAFKKKDVEKKFRNETKKFVNTKITQISANVKRIQESFIALRDYINLASGEGRQDKQQFVELTVAYRFADEAEVGVRAKAQAAWPVAFAAAPIFAKFPKIGEMFQGFMHISCPYIAPDYSGSHARRQARCPGQRDQEPYSQFVERMVGYLRLWLAIAVVQDDLTIVWQWLARSLNAPGGPAPIAATLMQCTLEMAASAALTRYKGQFVKLLAYIEREYLPELESLKGRVSGEEADQLRASHARLRLWLQKFNQTRQAPPPAGRTIEATAEADLNPDV